jgi:hypothetical protein
MPRQYRGSSSFKVIDANAPRRESQATVRAAARKVSKDARDGTPVRTGALRDGWRVVPAGNYDSRVTNAVKYGRYVEYGTRHHAPAAMLGKAVARARAANSR